MATSFKQLFQFCLRTWSTNRLNRLNGRPNGLYCLNLLSPKSLLTQNAILFGFVSVIAEEVTVVQRSSEIITAGFHKPLR